MQLGTGPGRDAMTTSVIVMSTSLAGLPQELCVHTLPYWTGQVNSFRVDGFPHLSLSPHEKAHLNVHPSEAL